jgi:hypothetical protein
MASSGDVLRWIDQSPIPLVMQHDRRSISESVLDSSPELAYDYEIHY